MGRGLGEHMCSYSSLWGSGELALSEVCLPQFPLWMLLMVFFRRQNGLVGHPKYMPPFKLVYLALFLFYLLSVALNNQLEHE